MNNNILDNQFENLTSRKFHGSHYGLFLCIINPVIFIPLLLLLTTFLSIRINPQYFEDLTWTRMYIDNQTITLVYVLIEGFKIGLVYSFIFSVFYLIFWKKTGLKYLGYQSILISMIWIILSWFLLGLFFMLFAFLKPEIYLNYYPKVLLDTITSYAFANGSFYGSKLGCIVSLLIAIKLSVRKSDIAFKTDE